MVQNMIYVRRADNIRVDGSDGGCLVIMVYTRICLHTLGKCHVWVAVTLHDDCCALQVLDKNFSDPSNPLAQRLTQHKVLYDTVRARVAEYADQPVQE